MIVNKAVMEFCLPSAVPLAMLESVYDGEHGPDLADLYSVCCSPSHVIGSACHWSTTRQGHTFWSEVQAHVREMEKSL